MLQINRLKYAYGDREFDFPNLSLEQGESCVIRGKSGSGKTTLLHILGGLLKIRTGEVTVDDVELHRLSGSDLEKWRINQVGLVLQQPIFPKYLTFREHLELILKHKGIAENQISEFANRLGVSHKLDSLPNSLSGGERQRMALLNSLIHKPSILLVDEATANLDDENASALPDMIFEHMPADGYVIMASHDARIHHKFNVQYSLV